MPIQIPIRNLQEVLAALRYPEVELFVVDVLRTTGRFSNIERNISVGGMQIDISATELAPFSGKWFFEIKQHKLVGVDVIQRVSEANELVQRLIPGARFVLVALGNLTASAREMAKSLGLEVWDAPKLADLVAKEQAELYFGERINRDNVEQPAETKSNALLEALRSISPGREHWSRFQLLSSEILEYLFWPPLESPRYELADADSRNKRDMIFENSTDEGFWHGLRSAYSAHYIVADAKNYGAPLKKQPVLDIAHYLKSYGCGLFGLLISRKGAGIAAKHAIREQWIGGQKMIIVLSDSMLAEMIKIKAEGGKPEEVIRKAIADFRTTL
jgi:hypothetical protein